MELQDLFVKIWNQYTELTPQAAKIHKLLGAKGDEVLNDHIAYRSIALPNFGIDLLKSSFEQRGYKICGEYEFEQKKLYAVHLEHEDKNLPKVFISELLIKKLSQEAQNILQEALYYVKPPVGDEALTCGRLWEASYKNYEALAKESEYAAWFYAYGYCANHFTVNVNALTSFEELSSLNDFLEEQGFKLNQSGGKIKGSAEVCLEQSSTMASSKMTEFSDGSFEVPSCYYEFAKRYALESGELYQGFVAQSADKIFESTNKV